MITLGHSPTLRQVLLDSLYCHTSELSLTLLSKVITSRMAARYKASPLSQAPSTSRHHLAQGNRNHLPVYSSLHLSYF